MKVRMVPHLEDLEPGAPSGIARVVEKYFAHLPAHGVELVKPTAMSYDLLALHAGAYDSFLPNDAIVAHNHGLYWTDDYGAAHWEQEGNQRVIDVLRHAAHITVPSPWVAEAFQRDMHLTPGIVPHGVDWDEWQGGEDQGYILWNKNRKSDVCDPTAVSELATLMPNTRFITTYANDKPPRNVRVLGTVAHEAMKGLVKGASLYLATTKETFGIGTLEALAAGVPVLGFDYGGTADLVTHGRTGYLAQPGDWEDLAYGANWLLKRRHYIGRNAADFARAYTWQAATGILAQQYADTLARLQRRYKVAVIIPCYNKAATLERAVLSALNQTLPPDYVVIVDNNSTDNSFEVAMRLVNDHPGRSQVSVMGCPEQGVAHARNQGIYYLPETDYVCCLDADDEIKPTFLRACLRALEDDNSVGIAYTGIEAVNPDGSRFVSQWPGEFDYEQFIVGKNQVPTCCVFRRELWQRAGGYRQRFAPGGAGAEDAELWLRMGALGKRGKKVSEEGLFVYYLGGQVSGDPHYQEPNWRAGKPWVEDRRHPFASVAKPANGLAHLVRQYDQPLISIIIPCGPGHAQYLVDCLDSVEAQFNRQWEVVLVADVDGEEWREIKELVQGAYPFVRLKRTSEPGMGAGHARNGGVEASRAPLLLFLDADDWLTPNALNILLAAYMDNPLTVIYGQYIGHAYIQDRVELARLRSHDRLLAYDEKSGEASVLYHGAEFDCAVAMRQPDARRPYIWNAVTSLVPRAFHREIGGFDTQMKSWEDWDYWLRMARAGKCFTRVEEPVFEYRFYTGFRRSLANPEESGDNGRQLSSELLSYMQAKYEKDGAMGCKSCGGGRSRRSTPPSVPMMAMTMNEGSVGVMTPEDFVSVELIDGNIGSHRIIFEREMYGYRSHGEVFKMRLKHAQKDNRVKIVESGQQAVAAGAVAVGPQALIVPPAAKRELPADEADWQKLAAKKIMEASDEDEYFDEDDGEAEDAVISEEAARLGFVATKAPEGVRVLSQDDIEAAATEGETLVPAKKIFDFTQIWGIGGERQDVLMLKGVRSLTGLIALDVVGIQKTLDVPEKTAERILKSAKEVANRR